MPARTVPVAQRPKAITATIARRTTSPAVATPSHRDRVPSRLRIPRRQGPTRPAGDHPGRTSDQRGDQRELRWAGACEHRDELDERAGSRVGEVHDDRMEGEVPPTSRAPVRLRSRSVLMTEDCMTSLPGLGRSSFFREQLYRTPTTNRQYHDLMSSPHATRGWERERATPDTRGIAAHVLAGPPLHPLAVDPDAPPNCCRTD